ncbi:MAG: phage tail sheath family protein [Aequorivita sp.]
MPKRKTYPGVYIEPISSGDKTITGVSTSITAFIGIAKKGPKNDPNKILSFGDYERIFGGLSNKSTMSFAVRDFFQNGGGEALIVRVSNTRTKTPHITSETAKKQFESSNEHLEISSTEVLGSEIDKTGLYALDKADIFNILCIPPYSWESDIEESTYETAMIYCEKRRAILLIDPPKNWKSMQAATTGLNNFDKNSHAAIYFPRLLKANPLKNNQVEEFVPCGSVAGVIAKTDTERGVWKSAAGTKAVLSGVSSFSVSLNDEENGKLNQLGINCLRTFSEYGNLIWGSRTLSGRDILASEYKYLPVRRTALYIEESLSKALKWVAFETNNESLWVQIRLNIESFMQNMYREGAFQGSTKEAYFVKCDSETTTQNDINLGIVNILVGFAPMKPAEFVILELQLMTRQVEV